MMKAIAIDDELPALQIIESFCKRADEVELLASLNKPGEALTYINSNPVDLLFLDINMPSLNGIDLYKAVSKKVMVIFTTAYSDFAVEGFELNAVDYLLKPFTFARFEQAVSKANDWHKVHGAHKSEEENSIVVRADYSFVKISFSDILYIESIGDYIRIHVANGRPVITRITMKNTIDLFPKKQFIRIHRSYMVSLPQVSKVRNKTVIINSIELPLSNSYEEEFVAAFTNRNSER